MIVCFILGLFTGELVLLLMQMFFKSSNKRMNMISKKEYEDAIDKCYFKDDLVPYLETIEDYVEQLEKYE